MNTNTIPYRWYIIAAVMLSTVMEILDTTIVTVSLPHMMGSLGADRDQISWVLTSYIVAAGMLMPLTGFLVNRFGCKRLLLINIVGFLLASTLCGLSMNLTQMVVFRLFQGLFGASLVPLSQFILRQTFPPEEQPKVMAIWGIGVMAAPIMGPTLGGYITDALNWRWIFYINVPVCIIDFFLVVKFIQESPIKKQVIDWIGMILMLVTVGALQLFLDRGQVDDWFSSASICGLFLLFSITFILFIFHSMKNKNPIINMELFKDRNFVLGTLAITFFSMAFFSSIMIMPQMLQTLFGYTSDLSGWTMAPRGVASGMMMALASRLLSKKMDPRVLIVGGLSICLYSLWWMSQLSLETGIQYITLIGFIQGLGIGAFFMPLSTLVYSTLPKQSYAEASGLFSFGRSIGNAMGVSLLITYLSRDTQSNWNRLGSYIQKTHLNVQHWLDAQHLTLNDPRAIAQLTRELSIQSNFVAYLHTYRMAAVLLCVGIVMSFFLRNKQSREC